MENQISLCLSTAETKEYATQLLLKLIEGISPNGVKECDVFLSSREFTVDAKEARDWAYEKLVKGCGWQTIYEYFSSPGRWWRVPELWRDHWNELDKDELVSRLQIKGLFKKTILKKMLLQNSKVPV